MLFFIHPFALFHWLAHSTKHRICCKTTAVSEKKGLEAPLAPEEPEKIVEEETVVEEEAAPEDKVEIAEDEAEAKAAESSYKCCGVF